MHAKPVHIESIKNFIISIRFSNNELKHLDVKSLVEGKYSNEIENKLFKKNIFNSAKVGNLGQILWENIATIEDINGKKINCEFDISPESAYFNSK